MCSPELEPILTGLLGGPPRRIERAGHGGNSRLYRVETATGFFLALKHYPSRAVDPRDRLGTEFAALTFMARHGVDSVPRPLAADRERGFALYQWIEGTPVTTPTTADMDQAIAFAAGLAGLRTAEGAEGLGLASEACLAGADIVAQVERRYVRLREVMDQEPALADFLRKEFEPLAGQAIARARDGFAKRGWVFDQPIRKEQRTLSPSDFGFHNAIRSPEGRLVFIDFEYFGWDDPVRLAADFPQHPGMSLDQAAMERYRDGMVGVFGADDGFADRLFLLYPLVGLRWCMILLNEFLPERWAGRTFAGAAMERRRVAQEEQLAKARRRLAAIRGDGMEEAQG